MALLFFCTLMLSAPSRCLHFRPIKSPNPAAFSFPPVQSCGAHFHVLDCDRSILRRSAPVRGDGLIGDPTDWQRSKVSAWIHKERISYNEPHVGKGWGGPMQTLLNVSNRLWSGGPRFPWYQKKLSPASPPVPQATFTLVEPEQRSSIGYSREKLMGNSS
jgi:hypothetical protein